MDTDDTLWLETVINDCYRKGSNRRDSIEGYRDGYSDAILQMLGLDKEARNAFRREQRMAEACYEV